METLKTIIVDDEKHCIDRLENLLLAHRNDVQVIGSYQSYSGALDAIAALHPDFIFLDVQLGDKTGFELLKALKSIDFDVVFTTAFDKYAVEAFRFSATDYLLKPILASDLEKSIGKLQKKVFTKDLSKKFDTLFHNLQQGKNSSKKIGIPTVEGLNFIQIADIVRCESDINYTHIVNTYGPPLTVARTLKQFEELLMDYNFFRVHKSHLINLSHVSKYNKGKGGVVTMSDGSEIEVSTRRKDLFLKRLRQMQMLLP